MCCVVQARFGETDQIERAMEVAKNDKDFTAALSDKSLFKSQIFWLATKGIGYLLLALVYTYHEDKRCYIMLICLL